MSSELMNALKMVANERSIGLDELIEAIEQAVTTAACKRLERENLEARFDQDRGEFDLFELLEVSSEPDDESTHISIEDAAKIEDGAKEGAIVRRHVEMEDLGRIAAQSVRQMIHKKGRELESHRMFMSYKARIGEMVTGRMVGKSHDSYIVEFEGVEGVLPPQEQLYMDRLERGRHVKLIITNVTEEKREPTITVSRNHLDLPRKLLELEAPEIGEGLVQIVAIARDPMGRTKMAVKSKKHGLDPVGTCVGVRGARIQPVVKELSGEKIDVFAWSDNPEELIASALTPAKNVRVILAESEKRAFAIVPDDQLSPAIGKKGINIRLATKLTGWELDVMSQHEYEQSRLNREPDKNQSQKRNEEQNGEIETPPGDGAA